MPKVDTIDTTPEAVEAAPPPSPEPAASGPPHLFAIDPVTRLYTPNLSDPGSQDLFDVAAGNAIPSGGFMPGALITYESAKFRLESNAIAEHTFSNADGKILAKIERARFGFPAPEAA